MTVWIDLYVFGIYRRCSVIKLVHAVFTAFNSSKIWAAAAAAAAAGVPFVQSSPVHP